METRNAAAGTWIFRGDEERRGRDAGARHRYFKAHHQEIVAGNIGNQYIYSTSTQLEVARYRADAVGDLLPMAWFAFEVDVVGDETSTTFFERVSRGYVQTIPVGIDRTYPGGPVKTLRVPGCGTFDFEYDVSTGHLSGYTYAPGFGETDPSAPCLPKMDGTAFPTVVLSRRGSSADKSRRRRRPRRGYSVETGARLRYRRHIIRRRDRPSRQRPI